MANITADSNIDIDRIARLIAEIDGDVASLIQAESLSQRTTLRLIPSENYVSRAVALAMATSFGNKYSEGYPHSWKHGELEQKNARYYRGQKSANEIERLAISRALQLFTPTPMEYHCNVQPLSGAPANLAVLSAFLNPGDTFMGMSLENGGHLTHGHKVSVTSKYYNAVQYGLNEDYVLDYQKVQKLACEHRPKLIFCGATVYPRIIDFRKLREIADEVSAVLVADISHISGLCATGLHPNPFPYADVVTTTTHKILRGPRGGLILCKKQYGPRIDMAVFPGLQGGPHMNTIAALAIALHEALQPSYKIYAQQVMQNARTLANSLQNLGFKLIGGGTENHLMLINVLASDANIAGVNGGTLAARLENAGIVVNKNSVPGDTKPQVPSGIRIGTPAITTLGMLEQDMGNIAQWIYEATQNVEDKNCLKKIHDIVSDFVESFTSKADLLF